MVGRMGHLGFRDTCKCFWHPRKWRDARGDDDAFRFEESAAGESHLETSLRLFNADDLALAQFRKSFLLIPLTVLDEILERDRLLKFDASVGFVMIEGQLAVRVGNVRGGPVGAEIHTSGHVVAPKTHGIAKNGHLSALVFQIGGGRKSERAGPDNRDVHIRGRGISHGSRLSNLIESLSMGRGQRSHSVSSNLKTAAISLVRIEWRLRRAEPLRRSRACWDGGRPR